VAFMEDERTTLTPPWEAADVPGWSWTEFTVGAATLNWSVCEAVDALCRVVDASPDA
jgi:hypothetical protein